MLAARLTDQSLTARVQGNTWQTWCSRSERARPQQHSHHFKLTFIDFCCRICYLVIYESFHFLVIVQFLFQVNAAKPRVVLGRELHRGAPTRLPASVTTRVSSQHFYDQVHWSETSMSAVKLWSVDPDASSLDDLQLAPAWLLLFVFGYFKASYKNNVTFRHVITCSHI